MLYLASSTKSHQMEKEVGEASANQPMLEGSAQLQEEGSQPILCVRIVAEIMEVVRA